MTLPLVWKSWTSRVIEETSTRKRYNCEAKVFINSLATSEFFKSRLQSLSWPILWIFRPLTINYDLIEVSNGNCWSIKNRSFVDDATSKEQVGKFLLERFIPTMRPKNQIRSTFVRSSKIAYSQKRFPASVKISFGCFITTRKGTKIKSHACLVTPIVAKPVWFSPSLVLCTTEMWQPLRNSEH